MDKGAAALLIALALTTIPAATGAADPASATGMREGFVAIDAIETSAGVRACDGPGLLCWFPLPYQEDSEFRFVIDPDAARTWSLEPPCGRASVSHEHVGLDMTSGRSSSWTACLRDEGARFVLVDAWPEPGNGHSSVIVEFPSGLQRGPCMDGLRAIGGVARATGTAMDEPFDVTGPTSGYLPC